MADHLTDNQTTAGPGNGAAVTVASGQVMLYIDGEPDGASISLMGRPVGETFDHVYLASHPGSKTAIVVDIPGPTEVISQVDNVSANTNVTVVINQA